MNAERSWICAVMLAAIATVVAVDAAMVFAQGP